jgi:hypothetical protein
MLEFLKSEGNASDRKLKLFEVACCRRTWHILTDELSRQGIRVAEHWADGVATDKELSDAHWASGDATATSAASFFAINVVGYATRQEIAADETASCAEQALRWTEKGAREESESQATLLRDLFGNPFKPMSFLPPCHSRLERRRHRSVGERHL